MKFIHAADFHLCTSYRSSSLPKPIAAQQRELLWESFLRLIETCKEESADLLLLCGDLYESAYAKSTDVRRIADAFASIPDTQICISCGNHDPLTKDSYYRLIDFSENVHVFSSELDFIELPACNARVYGYSWDKNRYTDVPFAFPVLDRNKTNFLCLHCDAISPSSYLPIKPDMLDAVGFSYVALGHIHKPMQVYKNIFYSGSLEPLDFSEKGKHGYFIGTAEEKKLSVKLVKSAKRQFVEETIELTPDMDYNAIRSQIDKTAKGKEGRNLFRLTFTGSVDPQISLERLIREAQQDFYCLLTRDDTVPDFNIEKILEENRGNLIGKFIESFPPDKSEPEMKKALLFGLRALLEQNGGTNA